MKLDSGSLPATEKYMSWVAIIGNSPMTWSFSAEAAVEST